ncbi:hypothetical protein CHX26_06925 [Porphyrobacter sp. HT-58-2]|uniref:hypothetical protein n=1 Tax=Porphyrobacter sp. HT-58-2 TaxID=2023229 RepID=UPI000CDCA35F|nr:hypothetical protein [Porphyrobacter sp. HT-58-2]AUX69264.1 hypothetical protein CHX26_06925 [Porphyrobacter sp. HT-58-2]
MSGATRNPTDYAVPEGVLGLKGPVEKPAPGSLPLRGDLAHMALAGSHLAAHYVIPHAHAVGAEGAGLRLNPRDDAEVFAQLPAGSRFELLDVAGEWVWGCPGPHGPAGWCRASELAPPEG